MAKDGKDFISDFRRFFGKGLAILLPSVLTLWILVQAFFFVDARVAQPINRGVRAAVMYVLPNVLTPNQRPEWYIVTPEELAEAKVMHRSGTLPSDAVMRRSIREEDFRRLWDAHWYFQFIGLGVAILLIYLAGVVLGGFIGRRVYVRVESFFMRLPIFKLVYPHVKQVVDLVLGERPMAFRRVSLVEYPRKGIWTLGFVTNDAFIEARDVIGKDVLTIFIPTTPAPFTGFTITVAADEVIDVPMTIDEAVRFMITAGVLVPDRTSLPAAGTITRDPIAGLREGPTGAAGEKPGPGGTERPSGGPGSKEE